MPATPEQCRKYRQDLKARALALIGDACVWCGSKENVDAAHVKPTALRGPGRGLEKRYKDVVKHQDHYRPMCKKHHRMFDAYVAGLRELLTKAREEPIPF